MLHVHRGERTDALADALAGVLAEPPSDPFADEVVAVPTRGVERWLTQRLSHLLGAVPGRGDGVAARVSFPSPGRLVAQVVAAADVPAGATGGGPDRDPWRPEALVWPVLETVDAVTGQPWCPALGAYLTGDERRRRRHAAAARLAALLASYGAQRPAMVRAWAAGQDTDGVGQPLPGDLAWQARLWREVRDRVGVPSPAERLPGACDRLRAEPRLVDLPVRLSVFGPTRLSGDQVAALHALAAHRDVHLWLPHPSPAMWRAVAEVAAASLPVVPRRRDDPTTRAVRHPLLAALARDARELQVALVAAATAPAAAVVADHHHPVPRPTPGGPAVELGPTLLARLQSDLRDDAPVGAGADSRPLLDPGDASVRVHACYGPARQVEVLREVLLGLLADDPTLEPRDILVMCPDVEGYAPLVSATFGLAATDGPGGAADPDGGAVHPGHRIRVRLADRALRRTNPLVDLAALLLDLAESRCTASQLLDLAGLPPVRRRFGWGDGEVERLRQWVGDAGVRWGLDPAHREPYRLAGLAQNTWRAGLDRILLGVAQRDEGGRHLGTAVPLDDVSSEEADLAGRLAEFVDRVGEAVAALSRDQPAGVWADALDDALDALAVPAPRHEWQSVEARRELRAALGADGPRSATAVLGPADVRSALGPLLAGRPTRANFRSGDLTVCSLVPMRSVPHRVVVLLGMDDGALGGGRVADDGDDVLARGPLVGERDRRSEQRQLVLDAVLAARDRLVVLHTGADDRTNAALPPAVPVAELLDALDRTVRTADGTPVRDAVVARHPLQPFDPRHFGVPAPPAHAQAGRFSVPSFDPVARAGAAALLGPRAVPEPFLPGPLPPPAGDAAPGDALAGDVPLDDLVAFVEHPVRAFLRRRLGVSLTDFGDDLLDEVSVDLAPLDRWRVGDRLLRAVLRGDDPAAGVRVERLRGLVPPGDLGGRALLDVARDVAAVARAARPWLVGEAAVVDAVVDLPTGVRVSGSAPGVHADQGARTVLRVEYSRLRAKHRLRAWVQVLALAAGARGATGTSVWRAVTVGRGRPRRPGETVPGQSPPVAVSVLTAPDPDTAADVLADLVALRRSGLTEPLPIAAEASAAYARRRLTGGDVRAATSAAGSAWAASGPDGRGHGDGSDPEHRLVWGDVGIAEMCASPPVAGDARGPASPAERSRFGALARRVWEPLLACEELLP
ncbi:MAG: exodeoxyribonuclease V subunit gamma [Kineosporiaceae bacterium]